MIIPSKVKQILNYYEADNIGTKTNLCRILMHGKLSGTGKVIILPVDQGFEHGPVRSFAPNPNAYDPHYHFELAIEAGLNAYAAPLGMLEAGANSFAGSIPLILKINSSNSLIPSVNQPDQAITATVKDALRLGCVGVGFTIYPGSGQSLAMIEKIKEIAAEAKSYGLLVIIWSYPRGADLSKKGETSVDITSYACHMAALLGAHIIKVKPPTEYIEKSDAQKYYEKYSIDISTLEKRIQHIKQSCFNGKRLVIFSGGENKDDDSIFNEVTAINKGGGDGVMIGRNSFQRPKTEALTLLSNIINILKN
jgi:class I fructose-bisphosphate aldolase